MCRLTEERFPSSKLLCVCARVHACECVLGVTKAYSWELHSLDKHVCHQVLLVPRKRHDPYHALDSIQALHEARLSTLPVSAARVGSAKASRNGARFE